MTDMWTSHMFFFTDLALRFHCLRPCFVGTGFALICPNARGETADCKNEYGLLSVDIADQSHNLYRNSHSWRVRLSDQNIITDTLLQSGQPKS